MIKPGSVYRRFDDRRCFYIVIGDVRRNEIDSITDRISVVYFCEYHRAVYAEFGSHWTHNDMRML